MHLRRSLEKSTLAADSFGLIDRTFSYDGVTSPATSETVERQQGQVDFGSVYIPGSGDRSLDAFFGLPQ